MDRILLAERGVDRVRIRDRLGREERIGSGHRVLG